MGRSSRWIAFLLIALLVAGLAVGLNSYADKQAEQIVANAPAQAAAQATPAADEISEEQKRCDEAQAAYDEIWDKSIEDPQDLEAEEQLEISLAALLEACEG